MPTGVSPDKIEARAYEIWEAEGRPHGKHEEHWRKAHEELTHTASDSPAITGRAAPAQAPARKPAAGKAPLKSAAASASDTTPSTKAPATRAKKTSRTK